MGVTHPNMEHEVPIYGVRVDMVVVMTHGRVWQVSIRRCWGLTQPQELLTRKWSSAIGSGEAFGEHQR